MTQNVPFPVYSSIKQHSVELQTATIKVIIRHFGLITNAVNHPPRGSECAGLRRIPRSLFVRTFCGFYMNSDSCCARAGGSVVPHGPWKWCLGNRRQVGWYQAGLFFLALLEFLSWLTWSILSSVWFSYWILPPGRPWRQSGDRTWPLGKRWRTCPPASQQGATEIF